MRVTQLDREEEGERERGRSEVEGKGREGGEKCKSNQNSAITMSKSIWSKTLCRSSSKVSRKTFYCTLYSAAHNVYATDTTAAAAAPYARAVAVAAAAPRANVKYEIYSQLLHCAHEILKEKICVAWRVLPQPQAPPLQSILSMPRQQRSSQSMQ